MNEKLQIRKQTDHFFGNLVSQYKTLQKIRNDVTGGSLPKRGMSRQRTKPKPPQNEIFLRLANLPVKKKLKAIKINEKKLMLINKKHCKY